MSVCGVCIMSSFLRKFEPNRNFYFTALEDVNSNFSPNLGNVKKKQVIQE